MPTGSGANARNGRKCAPACRRAYVVRAYGTPQEMRPGRPRENASEVWLYKRSDLELAVGFAKGVVAWTNEPAKLDIEPDPQPSRRQLARP